MGAIDAVETAAGLLMADSATFRTFVGAADRAAALLRIHPDELPPPADNNVYTLAELEALRPYGQRFIDDSGGYRRSRVGSGASIESGQVIVRVARSYSASVAPKTRLKAMKDVAAGMIAEMLDLVELGGPYLAADDIDLSTAPFIGEPEVPAPDQGLVEMFELTLTFGSEV